MAPLFGALGFADAGVTLPLLRLAAAQRFMAPLFGALGFADAGVIS